MSLEQMIIKRASDLETTLNRKGKTPTILIVLADILLAAQTKN